jgi:alkylation response protein AidB-like acyl-CoA dehydrogenase
MLSHALPSATRPASDSPVADMVGRVANVRDRMLAAGDAIERDRRIPADLLAALHREKFYRMLLPRAYGGEEVDPATFFRTQAALAAADGSIAWCICQANGCAMSAAFVEPAVARRVWGDDPHGVLAWGPGKGEATPVDDGWRISGRWAFASGSRHATWLGCHVPMPMPDGSVKERTLLVPADQVVFTDIWDVIGLRGTASDQFTVKDVVVPRDYSLVRYALEKRFCDGPLYEFSSSALYSVGFSATAFGLARAMLDLFKALAADKTPRRTHTVLRENNVIQAEVGAAEARLAAAEFLMTGHLDRMWEEAHRGALSLDSRMRLRLFTTFTIHEAKAVADMVYDASGATAIFKSNPLERRFRDIHTVTQQVQGRKIHFQVVGAYMLGLPPDTDPL